MDLAAVADELAAQLETITGLRVFAYPPPTLVPPAAIVSYPDRVTFDETYGRGMDRAEQWPIVLVVGKASDRAARDRVYRYADGSGAVSVKAVLEAGEYTAFETIRVAGVEFDVVTIAATDYIAALFTVDIAGPGSS